MIGLIRTAKSPLIFFLWAIRGKAEKALGFVQGYLIPSMGLNRSICLGPNCVIAGNSRMLCEPNGSLKIGSSTTFSGSLVKVSSGATLQIGENSRTVDSTILVEKGASIDIGRDVSLNGATIRAKGNGRIKIGSGCFFDPPFSLLVEDGIAEFGSESYGAATIRVCFDGKFKIGEHSGIGRGTQVRCHESVKIGNYCLISYDCILFDTNTHSTDWQHRRSRIIAGQRLGALEVERPDTKPVEIGDDVWIGMRSIILKNTSIGDRAIVGMGTTVTGYVPDDSIVIAHKSRVIVRGSRIANSERGELANANLLRQRPLSD